VDRLSASRRIVPLVAGFGLAAGGILWLLMPRTFFSEAAFLPTGGSQLSVSSNVSSVAGSLGINVPGTDGSGSLIYVPILKSDRVIARVLQSPLDPLNPQSATLLYLLSDRDDPENLKLEKAISLVRREILWVGMDELTGIVRIIARSKDPVLANRTASLFVEQLERYLDEERTARARHHVEFVRTRREETGTRLKAAENALREFHELNRKIDNSPDLRLMEGRLARDVRIQEEVFLALTRQYEIARVDAEKASPILEVLDPPTLRSAPLSPQLPILLGIGLLAGAILGSLLAVVLENLARAREAITASVRMLIGYRA
jgi:uncharacterized protein involved in exopolysaccharide biosynthesis